MIEILIVYFAVLSVAGGANDDLFTSNEDLRLLISTKSLVVDNLRSYIREEEERLGLIRSYVEDYESTLGSAERDEEAFVSNPLNSFLLIKKLTSDFKDVYDLIVENSISKRFAENITTSRQWYRWPSDDDLSGAASALMRLQEVYKINATDLSNGLLNGVDYGGPRLTAHDCFELGRQSYNNGNHYRTEVWMARALSKYDDEAKKTVKKEDIYEYLAFSAYVQGNMRRALKFTNLLLMEDPDHPRAQGNKLYYENEINNAGEETGRKKGDDGFGDSEEAEVITEGSDFFQDIYPEKVEYMKLCRGEDNVNPKIVKNLKCFYTSGTHPFLKLGPIKAEQVYHNPDLILYHDVVSDVEIQTIKDLAIPRFKRATVQNYKTGELETANYRISKTAWIKREENKFIDKIYQRVHDVTGLNMQTSEELQVSNYGIGGHYDPHFDFARREEKDAFTSLGTGNRIATWLFYLSDVEQGGATVFPPLGLSLWPKKGTAAFWYNLYKNGEGNEETRHAACPVLKGTKWVSNFWIHERGQEWARPCSLSPFE